MVPLYAARVADLRPGQYVAVRCRSCGHVAELPANLLRAQLPKDAFVKRLGPEFRCQQCHQLGADVDARRALGHFG
jgi:hypothetical protein